jgi:hypothetical protein
MGAVGLLTVGEVHTMVCIPALFGCTAALFTRTASVYASFFMVGITLSLYWALYLFCRFGPSYCHPHSSRATHEGRQFENSLNEYK